MLDIKYIRENREQVQKSAQSKNIEVDIGRLLELDEQRRGLTQQSDELRSKRNELSSAISDSGKPSQENIDAAKSIKSQIAQKDSELSVVSAEYIDLLKQVPNTSSEDTPIGSSEEENQTEYEKGDKPDFDFEPLNHWDIAKERDWIDKERAAKVAGARFAYLKGDIVKLQFALMQYVTDILTSESKLQDIIDDAKLDVSAKPFTPVLPPHMIRTDMFEAMDRLEPSDDRYKIEGEELWLQGSAEHVLGSMHADETLDKDELPLRYLGYATSFRKEAGTYGKDMEGIIRMHQFDKLEMEIISTPADGMNEHLLTIAVQEYLLNDLRLPYRKLLKCTADIGKPNFRGVDMDVWLPGQNGYKETHTADYMTDYQSRRLNTKVSSDGGAEYVHTIDATAFALGRALVAIIENYQTQDHKVRIPDVLQNYMGGVKEI